MTRSSSTKRPPRARSRGARKPIAKPKKPKKRSKRATAARRNGRKGGRPRKLSRDHAAYGKLIKERPLLEDAAERNLEILLLQQETVATDTTITDEKERRAELRSISALIIKLLPTTRVFQAAARIIRDHAEKTDDPIAGAELEEIDGARVTELPLSKGPH